MILIFSRFTNLNLSNMPTNDPNVKRFCATCESCFCWRKNKISPFALFYVDFGAFFAGVFGVV